MAGSFLPHWIPSEATRTAGLVQDRLPPAGANAPTELVARVMKWLHTNVHIGVAERHVCYALKLVSGVDTDDADMFYLELHTGPASLRQWPGMYVSTVRLFALCIPHALRRQRVATQLVQALELLATHHMSVFVVGPVLQHAWERLLAARGTYTQDSVFDYVYNVGAYTLVQLQQRLSLPAVPMVTPPNRVSSMVVQ